MVGPWVRTRVGRIVLSWAVVTILVWVLFT